MKIYYFYSLIILILLLTSNKTYSQEGSFVAIRGLFQTTQINNTDDQLYRFLSLKRTFGYAGGIEYFINSGATGFRSGITYSIQGQRYRGVYKEETIDTDEGKVFVSHRFESEVNLSYLKIPLLLNLNSLFNENETVNLTVYAGFQSGVLISASMKTDPPADEIDDFPDDIELDVRDFFRKLDIAFVSGAVINILLSENYILYTGFNTDRSIFSIENRNYEYIPGVSYPEDFLFPLSTKKRIKPSPRDFVNRSASNNITIGFTIGLAVRIG